MESIAAVEDTSQVLLSDHMALVFQRGFQEFLDSGDFVDIAICVEGQKFKLHKAVLCATIPYFQSMFLNKFKESGEEEVLLEGVKASGFREVINFVYSGKLKLSADTLEDILQAADLLQVEEALILCDSCILRYFKALSFGFETPFNLKEIYSLVTTYHRINLRESILHDIKATACECPGVYHLPLDAILEILHDNDTMFYDEKDALYFAKKWLTRTDIDGNRMQHALEVLSKVRLHFIEGNHLNEEIRDDDIFKTIEGIEQWLKNAVQKKEPGEDKNILLMDLPHRPRDCSLENFEVVTIRDTNSLKKDFYKFPTRSQIKSSSSNLEMVSYLLYEFLPQSERSLPCPPISGQGLFDLHLKHFSQYVFCISSHIDSRVYKPVVDNFVYDFLTSKWYPLPSPSIPRVNFEVVEHNKCLYIIGGQLNESDFVKSVEVYSPKWNTWKSIRPLPKAVAYCKCVSHNGDLYVIGGMCRNGPSSDVFYLRKSTLEWQTLTPSPFPLIGHQVLVQEPYIVVVNADARCNEETREEMLIGFYSTDKKEWITPEMKRRSTSLLRGQSFSSPILAFLQFDDMSAPNLFYFCHGEKITAYTVEVCGIKTSETGVAGESFNIFSAYLKEFSKNVHLMACTALKTMDH